MRDLISSNTHSFTATLTTNGGRCLSQCFSPFWASILCFSFSWPLFPLLFQDLVLRTLTVRSIINVSYKKQLILSSIGPVNSSMDSYTRFNFEGDCRIHLIFIVHYVFLFSDGGCKGINCVCLFVSELSLCFITFFFPF